MNDRMFTLEEYEDVKFRAYMAGLDAAREAVVALPMPPEVPFVHSDGQQVFVRFRDALAVIDALRGSDE